METTTNIDTVGIRAEFKTTLKQRLKLGQLIDYCRTIDKVYIDSKEQLFGEVGVKIEHTIYYNGSTTLATINTGSFKHGKGRIYTTYYISIVFAGLKSYDDEIDSFRLTLLYSVASWFNDRKIFFRFNQLDIAVDLECEYEQMLVLPIKQVPNVNYHLLQAEQYYTTTYYIEKKKKPKIATSRAYKYDKQFKEEIEEIISRFEVKLQSKFFNTRKADIGELRKGITKHLDRYAVLYVEDQQIADMIMVQHQRIQSMNLPNKSLEYDRLRLDRFRHYPNINYVIEFIHNIWTLNSYDPLPKKNKVISRKKVGNDGDFEEILSLNIG